MKSICKATVTILLVVTACSALLHGQEEGEYDEDSKINTNLAMPLSVPVNPISNFVNFGWGATFGAGYNMSRRNAFVGEFMWNRLFVSSSALAPLRAALNTPDLNGHGNLFAVTANYRFELRGHSKGVYFIGGAGFYYRNASLTKKVVTGSSTTCTPAWLFWGFACTSGIVTSNQTLASSASGTYGFNGGMGFTFKVAEPRYRFYIEARYHYAPTTRVNTQLIPINVGFRF